MIVFKNFPPTELGDVHFTPMAELCMNDRVSDVVMLDNPDMEAVEFRAIGESVGRTIFSSIENELQRRLDLALEIGNALTASLYEIIPSHPLAPASFKSGYARGVYAEAFPGTEDPSISATYLKGHPDPARRLLELLNLPLSAEGDN